MIPLCILSLTILIVVQCRNITIDSININATNVEHVVIEREFKLATECEVGASCVRFCCKSCKHENISEFSSSAKAENLTQKLIILSGSPKCEAKESPFGNSDPWNFKPVKVKIFTIKFFTLTGKLQDGSVEVHFEGVTTFPVSKYCIRKPNDEYEIKICEEHEEVKEKSAFDGMVTDAYPFCENNFTLRLSNFKSIFPKLC